jgi:hypothetical protein
MHGADHLRLNIGQLLARYRHIICQFENCMKQLDEHPKGANVRTANFTFFIFI